VEAIYDWYLDRLSVEGAPVGPSDFENLSYLMERIAALTEARHGLGAAITSSRYRELGQLHFQAIHHFILTGQPPIPELVMQSRIRRRLRERSAINHLERGEEAFERAVQAWQENPDGTELELASHGNSATGTWLSGTSGGAPPVRTGLPPARQPADTGTWPTGTSAPRAAAVSEYTTEPFVRNLSRRAPSCRSKSRWPSHSPDACTTSRSSRPPTPCRRISCGPSSNAWSRPASARRW
jgi:hypothetical protein